MLGPIVRWEDVHGRPVQEGGLDTVLFNLGAAAGTVQIGLRRERIAAGKRGLPAHVHTAEGEEFFVVLDGEGVCLLQATGKGDWEPEEHPLRGGTLGSLPAGTGVTHAFRAGPSGLTYLAYGTRRPDDLRWYPCSRKVWFTGLGVIGRLDPLHHWDG